MWIKGAHLPFILCQLRSHSINSVFSSLLTKNYAFKISFHAHPRAETIVDMLFNDRGTQWALLLGEVQATQQWHNLWTISATELCSLDEEKKNIAG